MNMPIKEKEVITLYGILIDRDKHEGNLFWKRYAAFFTIVSVLALAWSKGAENDTSLLSNPYLLGLIVSAGGVVAFAWFLVAFDGARWQEYFNAKILELEKEHSFLPSVYSQMPCSKFLPDVVAVAIIISLSSFVVWVVAAFMYDWHFGILSIGSSLLVLLLSRAGQYVIEKNDF